MDMMLMSGRSKIIIFILSLLSMLTACSDRKSDELIRLLNTEISRKEIYQKTKDTRIEQLTDSFLTHRNKVQPEFEYKMCERLYSEYISYQFDSAYHYSKLLKQIAQKINSPEYLFDSKVRYCEALYCAGYYHEVLDSIPVSISDTNLLFNASIVNYYDIYGRTYNTMSGSTRIVELASIYAERSNYLMQKALQYTQDSIDYYILKARIATRENRGIYIDKAVHLLKNPYDIRAAVLYSLHGKNEFVLGNNDLGLQYNSMAAIVDIRNSTRNALALINIANVLDSEKRELKLASEYLSMAFKDVSQYGAVQRISEINTILPAIEAEMLNTAENNKIKFIILFVIVTLLLIGIVVAYIRIVWQAKVLSNAKKELQEINRKLKESNTIKDEYLGHYLVENSALATLLHRTHNVINRNIKQKNYSEIPAFLAKIKSENIHEDFDRIFLKIFPDFVTYFNNLVEESAKIEVGQPNSLTPTLRIFALIRLGITDSTTISKILNCSLRTVYNYRNRIKSKAIVNKEDFEQLVKKIGS